MTPAAPIPPVALDALADDVRRRIVALLAEGSRTVSELLGHFDFSQPALSRHLRVLREAGLVRFDKDGRTHRYALEGGALRDAGEWMLAMHALWSSALDRLGDVLDEELDA